MSKGLWNHIDCHQIFICGFKGNFAMMMLHDDAAIIKMKMPQWKVNAKTRWLQVEKRDLQAELNSTKLLDAGRQAPDVL